MKKISRSDEKILDDVRSAGQGFLGNYMEDLLKKAVSIDLNNRDNKNRVIEEYFKNQYGFYDEEKASTRTRVNAALRIIRADKVIFALQQVNRFDPRVDEDAVKKANCLCEKIKKGKIEMPKLC